jgi:hypothetical protein
MPFTEDAGSTPAGANLSYFFSPSSSFTELFDLFFKKKKKKGLSFASDSTPFC